MALNEELRPANGSCCTVGPTELFALRDKLQPNEEMVCHHRALIRGTQRSSISAPEVINVGYLAALAHD